MITDVTTIEGSNEFNVTMFYNGHRIEKKYYKVYTDYNGALLDPKDYTVRYLVGDVDITDNKKFTTSIISMQEQPLFSSRP